jgi:GrpB-like predicted nucleotidyltransferase (UPF0157 family)
MVIVEYDYNWVNDFSKLKELYLRYLTHISGIEHVGSTSIIGMCAKPIIDIDICVNTDDDLRITANELIKYFGYIYEGDLGIPGRDAFSRKNSGIMDVSILDTINHHLYVCKTDGSEYKRHILFRNYLNKNKNARDEYRKIKMEIIRKHGNADYKKYVNAKETDYGWFFEKILKEAGCGGKCLLSRPGIYDFL